MLDELAKVDWSAYQHAFGPATDVQDELRRIATGDAGEVEGAVEELWCSGCHQGSIYEVTATVVPFLVALLQRPETSARWHLANLLASIAESASYAVEGPLDFSNLRPWEKLDPDFEANARLQQNWMLATKAAVAAAGEAYWALLDDPQVRVCMPYLMSHVPSEHAQICQRFPARIAATDDPMHRASLMLSLVLAGQASSAHIPGFGANLEAENPFVRLADALGVLMLGEGNANLPQALDIYLKALEKYQAHTLEDDPSWLWTLGDGGRLLHDCLDDFRPEATPLLLQALPGALAQMDWHAGHHLAARTLHLGFDLDALPRSKEALNPLQRALLDGLCQQTNVCRSSGLVDAIHEALGIADGFALEELKAYLDS